MQILIETAYLPPVSWIYLMARAEVIWLDQHEHYVKRSCRSRCALMGANGPIYLSIPLEKGKNQQMPIREVKLAYREDWQRLHWETIKSAYGRAPFYPYYADKLEQLIKTKETFLFDYNLKLLEFLLKSFRIAAPIKLNDSFERHVSPPIEDFRSQFYPEKLIQDNPVKYPQVFEDRFGFAENLSALDLLMCNGNRLTL
jgi:hypothetical protein